jgi:glycosyltransferase involved in cell wall biosynthesis/3-hydroxymyristoyl/3-hydroxydecanoyl-(acyl carrier protein) dehydratase
MLLGDFYTYKIIDNKEGVITASIVINKEHSIFKGHFPTVPVVPGVCQVQIIKEILNAEYKNDLSLSAAREIKFLNLINPEINNELLLSISYEEIEGNIIKVSAQFYFEETYFLKMKAEFIKKKKLIDTNTSSLNFCVIIPSYNNSKTLKAVIDDVKQYTNNIIVVNDGSTDSTPEILSEIKDITIVTHSKNRGKGIALKTGFAEAIKSGFKYAITIDSDGQHSAKDILLFLEKNEKNPDAIIIGARKLVQENMPGKNSFANKFSNFWFSFQTGTKLEDTQSGYRLYPLHIFKKMRFFSAKYEYELEVIVRASWKGIPIETVSIDAYYAPKEERITHFRPFIDFTRISILNTIFTFLAIVYYKPRKLIRIARKKKLRQIIKEDILGGKTPNNIASTSIGLGVFMSIFPIWGYQTAASLLIAHFFKLNKAIVFLAVSISLTPLLPLILYMSFVAGGFALGNGTWSPEFELTIDTLKENLLQYVLGSVVFATLAGTIMGMLSYLIIPIFKKNKADA